MAYIKDDVLNEIRSKADIVDIIGSYLKISPKGNNYVAKCPFHKGGTEKHESFTISPSKQIYNCFSCPPPSGGNVFSFVMRYLDVTFPEAVEIIAQKIGYNLKIDHKTKTESKNKEDYELMDLASLYYQNNITTKHGIEARKYLENRGITEDIIKEFNIGIAINEPNAFYNLASNKEYSVDILEKLGLINKNGLNIYDTFTNRIMIPIENLKGQVVGFTGRIFHGEENIARYINSKETEIFKKSAILFNYHNAREHIREEKKVIVVEGNMDAISLSARGIKNVVALMGVALSDYHIDTLKKLGVPVILMLDNDRAGEDATIKNGELLANAGIDVNIVRLSGEKDPDEYIRANGVDSLKENINHALKYIDYKLEYLKKDKDLNSIEGKTKYINEVIDSINNEDDLTKTFVIDKISKEFAIDANILKNKLPVFKPKYEEPFEESITPLIKKKSKYHKASHKILYYMMNDEKYISIYKNKLGYFKEREERVLASEIIYYNDEISSINIADFTTHLMNSNEDLYNLGVSIVGENSDTSISDLEYTSCIECLLKIYQNDKINDLKLKIKNELDMNKKLELMDKLAELKKEV